VDAGTSRADPAPDASAHLRTGAGAGEVDLVGVYLSEIGRQALLDRDDEVRLAQAIERGTRAEQELAAGGGRTPAQGQQLARQAEAGSRARRRFVEANLRLVVSVAKRYRRPGVDILDLIQAGNVGLLRAVEGFQWRLGNRFSTYATWWICQAVVSEMGDADRTIRLPAHLRAQVFGLARTRDRLRVELGHEPELEELAAEADVPVDRVRDLLWLSEETVSLSFPVGESDSELGDVIADRTAGDPADIAAADGQRQEVEGLLTHLGQHQADVLRLRFGFDGSGPRSLAEVGHELGISRERVRQIESRALRSLGRDESTGALRTAS
jgi:RNA polymerase sigma factor (sigma-70 family)